MSNLTKKTQDFAHHNNLFKTKQKILVGVSGGADSICLLNILIELKKKYNFSLKIAHVNYGLRGDDSIEDEKFVIKIASEKGLDVEILDAKKKCKKGSTEDLLRKIRYDFFEDIRNKIDFDYIAVAHNMNDQAETLLMRLIRGSGLQGLAAMKSKQGKIIRPLLFARKDEILQYLDLNGFYYRKDKTNEKPMFFRNKIRLELIPFLKENYNPKIEEVLATAATVIGEDYEYIINDSKKNCNMDLRDSKKVKLSVSELRKKHKSVARNCIRLAVSEVKGSLLELEASHIEEVLKIVASEKGKSQVTFLKGLSVERKGDILTLCCLK